MTNTLLIALAILLTTNAGLRGEDAPPPDLDSPLALDQRWAPEGDFYAFSYPQSWTARRGQGYVELRATPDSSTAGCWIRIYALGLRSIGGKFRNLEHVVDDMIFQTRDEFHGTVSAKSDYTWSTATADHSGRQITGERPDQQRRIALWFIAAPHPTPGVVMSFTVAGPPDRIAPAKKILAAIMSTIEMHPIPVPGQGEEQ